MAKKKIPANTTPEIKPEDTSPVIVDPLYDPLHEGKTMQVRIAPGTTRPLPDKKAAKGDTQKMEPVDLEKDLATPPPDDGPSTQPLKAGKPGKPGRWRWVLLGILLMLIGAGIGGWIGYNSAVKARVAEQKNKVALVATTQFQLALVDQANGNLDMARKRLEYIVQLNPQFPGVTEKLTEVMMAQAVKVTPTVVAAVPTPVPTKDTRNTEELFVQARQQAANKEWNAALTTLDNLRQIDRTYRAVQTDGLYYIALRNRGINRINTGMLEQGIYDITMASQFGPLDKDAVSYSQTASYYLSGVAAWAVDWPKVLEFFSQFYSTAPGLRDASGMTAAERYRKGSILYGDELVAKGDPCSAVQQYQNALAISSDDTTQGKLTTATNQCTPPTQEVKPTEPPSVATTEPPSVVTTEPPVATTEAPVATTGP